MSTINAYNFEVYHIKGKKNTFSDYLSRKDGLTNVEENEKEHSEDDAPLVICAISQTEDNVLGYAELNNMDLKANQENDQDLQIVIRWKEDNYSPEKKRFGRKEFKIKKICRNHV